MAPETPILFGLPPSPYVQRAALALLECGQEWQTKEINPLNGETKSEDYLKINPIGKVPAYQDADITFSEGRAIARYVFEKHGEKGVEFMGRDALERAQVNRWIDIEATSFTVLVTSVVSESVFKSFSGKEPDEAKLKEGEKKLSALLDVYDAHLAKHKYLACDRLTFADLTHIPNAALLEVGGHQHLISSRPHVAEWWERITSRPSWQTIQAGSTIGKIVAARKAA